MVSQMYRLVVAVASVATAAAQSTAAIRAAEPGVEVPEPQFDLIDGNMNHVGDIVGLTAAAQTMPAFMADLSIANTDNANNFPTEGKNVAYINCDASSYPGNLQAINIVQLVMKDLDGAAILLYSQSENACFANATADAELDQWPIYSMVGTQNATSLLNQLENTQNNTTYPQFIMTIQREGNGNIPLPGGPSPSTAVAMIILYSITGVITALFLVIIMSGAIRAHRHPERYGPRGGVGRTRQSRARGIARAMLDTLPIVKFGEDQQPKPNDVELGTRSDQANDKAATTTESSGEGIRAAKAKTIEEAVQSKSADNANGIAPAEARSTDGSSSREGKGLECSICTEDFERGQDVRVLPCDHRFHAGCVDQWLLNVSGTCPLCRIDLRAPGSNEGGATDPDRNPSDVPPLEIQESDQLGTGTRRRSTLRSLLGSTRQMTQEERIAELRRLRTRENANGPANDSRRRRLAERLHRRFGIRTRNSEQDDYDSRLARRTSVGRLPEVGPTTVRTESIHSPTGPDLNQWTPPPR